MDPQLMQGAFGRPQTFAEKSQATMLEPLNRYKSALGRASSPAMQEALRRQTSLQNVAPEGQQYLPGAPLAAAGAALGRYGRWGGYEDYTNPVAESQKPSNAIFRNGRRSEPWMAAVPANHERAHSYVRRILSN